MALILVNSGSQSLVAGDPNVTLFTTTTSRAYVLAIDASALASGESLLITLATKIGTATVNVVLAQVDFADALHTYMSPPIPSTTSFTIYVAQTGGTGRSYPWRVYGL